MLEAAAGNILQQVFLKASKAATKEYQNVTQATQLVQKHCGKAKCECEPFLISSEAVAEAGVSVSTSRRYSMIIYI
jgi:hypothetical protein